MKINITIFTLLLSFSLLSCSRDDDTFRYEDLIKCELESMNMPRPEGSYNYPVYPGMKEWATFKTTQEMVDACQVPIEVLKKQSTQEVIQAIWEYPFLFEISSSSDHYQMYFENVFFKNNAYNELILRSDAGSGLSERLTLVNVEMMCGRFLSRSLEIILSQPVFLSQLNDDQKKVVVKTAFRNDSLKEKTNESPGMIYRIREITWLLIGRTMFQANYPPFMEDVEKNTILRQFIETSELRIQTMEEYLDIIQCIITHGENYIN